MGELYLKRHHSFPRIMNVLILILLIGLWESKVQGNLKDPWRHFGPNCSQPNNQRDIVNLLVLHQEEKKQVMTHRRKTQLQMDECLILLCDVIRNIHYVHCYSDSYKCERCFAGFINKFCSNLKMA